MKITLLLTAILLLGACSSIPLQNKAKEPDKQVAKNFLKEHLIYIDKKGNLIDPYTKKVIQNEDEYVGKIFEKLGNKNLTIFIHGGLNTFQNATKKTNQILSYYDDTDSFIVVIGWEAGAITNYVDHLLFIRNGERRPFLGPVTSPLIFVEDAARSVAHAPRATAESVMIQATVPIQAVSGEEKAYYTNLANLQLMKNGINIKLTGESRGLGAKQIASILNPIKFATAPFVDGFGRGAWNSMSRRTEQLVFKETSFNKKKNSKTAVSKFLKLVNDSTYNPEITIIGHSMGSMVANNILVRNPNLNYKDIVYMGAAATLNDIESKVVPTLLKNPDAHFYNLSLDPYLEISESTALDSVPRGSLLIWIDTYLSSIKSFTDKTSGGWFNIIRAADTIFPDSVKNRVYLTKFGFHTGPQKHGEFDEFKFWNSNFWTGEEDCGLLLMHQHVDKNMAEVCTKRDKNHKSRIISDPKL